MQPMNEQQSDATTSIFKMVVAWAGTVFGGMTLNKAVLWATLLFTILQIVILVRDKFLKRGGR